MAVETLKGIDRILLFRVYKPTGAVAASKLAFQTEHEVSMSRDVDSTKTKDGTRQVLGDVEIEISATSIVAKGDAVVSDLKKAFLDGDIIEIWDIDRSGEGTSGKYPATYFQGYMTDFSQNPNAEDDVELSMDFAINAQGVEGEATLTAEQNDVLQYAFTDTVAGE